MRWHACVSECMQSIHEEQQQQRRHNKKRTWAIFSWAILSLQWISWQNSCVVLKAFPVNARGCDPFCFSDSVLRSSFCFRLLFVFVLPDSLWILIVWTLENWPSNHHTLAPSLSLLYFVPQPKWAAFFRSFKQRDRYRGRPTNKFIAHRALRFFDVNTPGCIVLSVLLLNISR